MLDLLRANDYSCASRNRLLTNKKDRLRRAVDFKLTAPGFPGDRVPGAERPSITIPPWSVIL